MHSAALVALSATACLSACGGDDEHAGHADAGFNCELDGRGDVFSAGMSRAGEAGYGFTLVDALPSPPTKNNNAWTVQLMDPDGQPAIDLGLTAVPFMPDHGHGTPIAPVVTAGDDGSFTVDPLNLWMPGLWEITLTATDGDAAVDAAVFSFCIDG